MKSILFVIPTIACGGAEKALVELLKNIDYNEYKVDLLMFRKDDMYFLNDIPKEVNILDNDLKMQYAFYHVKHLLKPKMFLKHPLKVLFRCYQTANDKIRRILRVKKYYYNWKTLKKIVPDNETKYDIAIGFLEGNSIYYVVDKVISDRKYGFFRTNYKKGGFDKDFDIYYFSRLNYLFAISENMKLDICKEIPEIKQKVQILPNVINVENIIEKSRKNIDCFEKNSSYFKFVSVGNLRYVKGYDIAVFVAKVLKSKNYKFKWYILGEGRERKNLEKLIKKNNLQNEIILLGLEKNPYVYIKKCNIFVQLSRHEGLSNTVREAKILEKPIVITDCPGMSEQIKDHKTGSIVKSYDPEMIADSIIELINNEDLRNEYVLNLKKENKDQSVENLLKKFYEFIN